MNEGILTAEVYSFTKQGDQHRFYRWKIPLTRGQGLDYRRFPLLMAKLPKA